MKLVAVIQIAQIVLLFKVVGLGRGMYCIVLLVVVERVQFVKVV